MSLGGASLSLQQPLLSHWIVDDTLLILCDTHPKATENHEWQMQKIQAHHHWKDYLELRMS